MSTTSGAHSLLGLGMTGGLGAGLGNYHSFGSGMLDIAPQLTTSTLPTTSKKRVASSSKLSETTDGKKIKSAIKRRKKARLMDGMTTYTDDQGRVSTLPQGFVPVLLSEILLLRSS